MRLTQPHIQEGYPLPQAAPRKAPSIEGVFPIARRSAVGITSPAFGANVSSEVTRPFCRLPIATLLYELKVSSLGGLMRLFGTDRDGARTATCCFHEVGADAGQRKVALLCSAQGHTAA